SPWLIRKIVVSGFILPFRPRRTAHAYERIWEPTGSPLLRHSRALRDALARCIDAPIELAMRYGEPSIGSAVERLIDVGATEIVLLPLYPHHADSTRTTSIDAVEAELARPGADVSLSVIPPFYADPDYLDALSNSIARTMPADSQLLLF